MNRLCVIGSPIGAAEKFDAKRVIAGHRVGLFFIRVKSGWVIRGNPIAPLDANATIRQSLNTEEDSALRRDLSLSTVSSEHFTRGYNCIINTIHEIILVRNSEKGFQNPKDIAIFSEFVVDE